MIQRIQTLWLLLVSVLLFALFLFPYWQFADASGLGHALKVPGHYSVVDGQPARIETYWHHLILLIIAGVFPLYIIFQFNNRKKQLKLIFWEILLVGGLAGFFVSKAQKTMEQYDLQFSIQHIGVGFFLLPIALVFLLLASSAIRKDEKLVRSADRLR